MPNPPSLRELCAKATPGPWVIAPNVLSLHEQSSPLKLAIQNPDKYPDVCRFLNVPHADANARLIARLSPEVMLAVYEALGEMNALATKEGWNTPMFDVSFGDALRTARTALTLLDGLGGAT